MMKTMSLLPRPEHHLVLAILSFHSSDRKSPLSSYKKKTFIYCKSAEYLCTREHTRHISSKKYKYFKLSLFLKEYVSPTIANAKFLNKDLVWRE